MECLKDKKPEEISKWFNSAPGLDINVLQMDVKPNGKFRFIIPNADSDIITPSKCCSKTTLL